MYHFIFVTILSLFSSVAIVQASLSFTQVFYFINNLCSIELVNRKINIFIKVTETRVFVVYVCVSESIRSIGCYICVRVNSQFQPFKVRWYMYTATDYTPHPTQSLYIYLDIYYLFTFRLCNFFHSDIFSFVERM